MREPDNRIKQVGSHTFFMPISKVKPLTPGTGRHIINYKMTFSSKEMTAIVALARAMASADGKIEAIELKIIANELVRFGVPQDECTTIFRVAEKLNIQEALTIVTQMGREEKKYVAAYLGTMIVADNDVDESELKLWRFISEVCGLPSMSIHEAVKFMANF